MFQTVREDLFESDVKDLEDVAKVWLLLRKLDAQAHNKYTNYIFPQLPKELTCKKTVETRINIFGSQSSLFSRRYCCLIQLGNTEADDIISYAAQVNRACEHSKSHNMKTDHFKYLIFICGLTGQTYADIRARLLSRIDTVTAAAPVTLHNLVDEYQRLVYLKADTSIIEKQPSKRNIIITKSIDSGIKGHNTIRSISQTTLAVRPNALCSRLAILNTPEWMLFQLSGMFLETKNHRRRR